MVRRLINISLLIIGGFLALSCSNASAPVVPSEPTGARTSDSTCLGVFQIVPTPDMSSAIVTEVRSAQFNVTKWAKIDILAAVWDDMLRTWTLTVKVTNPTQFTGWGVQAIFTDLGGKEMRWPDGFLWLDLDGSPGPERYPFFAIEKTTVQRAFPGLHYCIQDVTFHFPDGVNKWIPITFFIDANLPGPRPEPMVEDLGIANTPPPCQHATVTAHVQDHQSPSSDLTVWVDLTSIGGSDAEPLYDDGQHGDALPGDGIFGAEFNGGVLGEIYTLTVYARDPESNTAENDVLYSPMEFPPLPPVTFEDLMIGPLCLFTDEHLEIISDQDEWNAFWAEFSPWDMPPPAIDFENKRVIAVCIGSRPDDCYSVEVDNVDWSGENCGWAVNYTETVPGPNCKCNDVVVSPFHLITVNKAGFDIMFKGSVYEDPCSDPQDPCLDLIQIANGTFGTALEKTTTVIKSQADWDTWWAANVGGGGQPVVDFTVDMLFAVTQGWCSTSGYFATVDSACLDDADELEITVGWHIPGENCMVLQVITYPYAVYSAKKIDNPYYWTTYDDIYPCK